jgi:hypothetical protein
VLCYLAAELDGTIRHGNRAFAILLGQPMPALIGQSLWPLLRVEDTATMQARVRTGERDVTHPLLLTFGDAATAESTLDCLLDVQPNGFLLLGEVRSTGSR